MPRPARLDKYGHLLPDLADARQQSLKDTPSNQAHQRLVHVLLEEQLRLLLRRGVYAELTMQVQIQDGSIHGKIVVTPRQFWAVPGVHEGWELPPEEE